MSGPNDVTGLIVESRTRQEPRVYRYTDECKPAPAPGFLIREGRVFFYACTDEEADSYEELWRQHTGYVRQLLGDPGRH